MCLGRVCTTAFFFAFLAAISSDRFCYEWKTCADGEQGARLPRVESGYSKIGLAVGEGVCICVEGHAGDSSFDRPHMLQTKDSGIAVGLVVLGLYLTVVSFSILLGRLLIVRAL